MVATSELLPFFTAFWFFLAAAAFTYRARTFPRNVRPTAPITAYLVGIGLFFTLQGYGDITQYSCPGGITCTDTGAALATMLAASFIARFPLRSALSRYADELFGLLVAVSVVTSVGLSVTRPGLVLVVAEAFAFVVAGLGAVGYLVYRGLTTDSSLSLKLGVVMAPCCILAHGLAAFGLVAVVSVPLVGVPLETPSLFAVLAPVSLLGVLGFFTYLERRVESSQPDTTPATISDGGTTETTPAGDDETTTTETATAADDETTGRTDDETTTAATDDETTTGEMATATDDETAGRTDDGTGDSRLPADWPPSRDPGCILSAIRAVEGQSDDEFLLTFGPYMSALEDPQPGVDHDEVRFVFLGLELRDDGETPAVATTTPVRYVVEVDGTDRFVGNRQPDVDLELHLPPESAGSTVEEYREAVLDHLRCQARDVNDDGEKTMMFEMIEGAGKRAVDELDLQ